MNGKSAFSCPCYYWEEEVERRQPRLKWMIHFDPAASRSTDCCCQHPLWGVGSPTNLSPFPMKKSWRRQSWWQLQFSRGLEKAHESSINNKQNVRIWESRPSSTSSHFSMFAPIFTRIKHASSKERSPGWSQLFEKGGNVVKLVRRPAAVNIVAKGTFFTV